MERCHVVYDVLKTHIQFGAYRFGDVLPTMENNTENFLVSLDTIRSAYLRLEREGYVTLSQNCLLYTSPKVAIQLFKMLRYRNDGSNSR